MSIDLKAGVRFDSLRDGGALAGRVGEDEVVLVRKGDQLFAIGAHCTHYRGALADGLVVGNTIRCPLHHACFDLATGEALRAPALDPIARWRVERQGDVVVVGEKLLATTRAASAGARHPASIVIVGGGAAGLAAADMLRRESYDGPIAMISADADPPVDRPNLSKDYLAGEAQEDWIPLWPADLYRDKRIDLVLNTRAKSIDTGAKRVLMEDGSSREFGSLLIATGADPIRLPIPGADTAQIFRRQPCDCRARVSPAGGLGPLGPLNHDACGGRGGEFHRPRSCGRAPDAGRRGGRGRTGAAAARARDGRGGRSLRSGHPPGARSRVSPR
jgi:nitrite reductase/ring-hydroxylating ferredoxin subunit